jgi:GT2 family glycosyltransferase
VSAADLTIAIPAFEDDPAVLQRVLDGAVAQAEQPVVVVDMSETDLVRTVADGREGVRYVPYPQSSGVSDSRNECIRRSETRHVLFLDSDVVPEAEWAEAMRRGFDQERVALVGARVLPDFERTPPALFRTATASDWLSLFDLGEESREVPRVIGSSYAIDRERFREDPFDERFGRRPGSAVAHEEVQLALDAAASGWRCWYAGDARVRHQVGGSRLTWRWMLKRAYTAGAESRLAPPDGLEPLPRRIGGRDRAFQALVAPTYVAGRLLSRAGPPRAGA